MQMKEMCRKSNPIQISYMTEIQTQVHLVVLAIYIASY